MGGYAGYVSLGHVGFFDQFGVLQLPAAVDRINVVRRSLVHRA